MCMPQCTRRLVFWLSFQWLLPVCQGVRNGLGQPGTDSAEGIEGKLSNGVISNAQLLYNALHGSNSSHKKIPKTNGFFTQCGLADAALLELKNIKLQLHAIGQLAKSGDFFASDTGKWLVKAIKPGEQSELDQLSTIRVGDGRFGCESFHPLLLPIPLAFAGTDKRPYLVMRNETQRLEELGARYWQVLPPFDVKPLPNLSGDLAKLVEELLGPRMRSLVPLKDWLGWDAVRSRLKHDFELLGNRALVDFSLFVHVLRPTIPSSKQPKLGGLADEVGCVVEPLQRAVVCFSVIDFLLKFDVARAIESKGKQDKFAGYDSKMLQAVDCLGDLHVGGCERYRDYGTIRNAGSDGVKGALIGTVSFSKEYACTVMRPTLRYDLRMYAMVDGRSARGFAPGRTPVLVSKMTVDRPWEEKKDHIQVQGQERVEMVPEPLQSLSYGGSDYEPSVAGVLKDMCAQVNGVRTAGSNFIRILAEEHDSSMLLNLTEDEISACKEGLLEFATSSMVGKKHSNLGNILWSPQHRSLLVVRGKSPIYSRDKVAIKMKSQHCFMLTRFYRCQAVSGTRTIFDYKRNFGPVEVLQVVPSVGAPELPTYRKILEMGLLKN